MTAPPDSLRKVAIVLSSLDSSTADALIEQMPSDRARQVREALVELEQLDPIEQESVVGEFLRQSYAAREAELQGVEIEAGLASRLESTGSANLDAETAPAAEQHAPSPAAAAEQNSSSSLANEALFAFSHDLDPDELAEYLEHERPQTVAVVLAQLPADRSADVLARMPSSLQAEALLRVAQLGELDAQAVREVEQGLRQRIVQRAALPRRRHRGAGAVASILKAADAPARRQILENLAAHQPELAARFAPPQAVEVQVAFDDLAHVSELTLAKIFAECDSGVLVLALAGAHPSLARRVLGQLPSREAKQLKRRLDGLGPTSLADVESAQDDVVAVALRLHAEGRIELGARRTLSLTM
jgi:flagellar motor switch protein FliG